MVAEPFLASSRPRRRFRSLHRVINTSLHYVQGSLSYHRDSYRTETEQLYGNYAAVIEQIGAGKLYFPVLSNYKVTKSRPRRIKSDGCA